MEYGRYYSGGSGLLQMAHKLTHLSAVELARLVRTKEASPVEVVEAHLAAIQKINPAVNAFCTVAAEKALVWAREAERAVKKGAKLKALHGVPVAIKDLTATADIRTTFGSTLFRDHVPTEDAEVVRRLKVCDRLGDQQEQDRNGDSGLHHRDVSGRQKPF